MTTIALSTAGQSLLNQILSLPAVDRRQIAEAIDVSLNDSCTTEEWEAACIEEADRRMARVRSGVSEMIPGERAMQELRNRQP